MRLPSAEFLVILAVVAMCLAVYLTRDVGYSESSSIRAECDTGICVVR